MQRAEPFDAVIAGAGIAGVSTAYHLTVGMGLGRVLICDPRPPLSLTSDKSTECYRNWWPGPGNAMVALMGRSIDLLDEWALAGNNAFNLSRRGYLYATADPSNLRNMALQADEISRLGAGELRVHRGRPDDPAYRPALTEGFGNVPEGADLFLDGNLLRTHFPFLSNDVVGGVHARRAGWLSAQQLGSWLLSQARDAGAELMPHAVSGLEVENGRVLGATLESGAAVATTRFVNAAGPFLSDLGKMAGVELPVFSEVHRKISFQDSRASIPRNAPMLIWNDSQALRWGDEERAALRSSGDLSYLLHDLGPGAHCRPEGTGESTTVLGLWEYRTEVREPTFPLPDDPLYPEIVIKGLATMIPAMDQYLERLPTPYVDGGYYTKTKENRPLIGPAGPTGSYVLGALSGYGIMAAPAAGELAALHLAGGELPDYAYWFDPSRYHDPDYVALMEEASDTGQI